MWACACSARNWERSEAISGTERPAERRASNPAGSASAGADCGGAEEDDDGDDDDDAWKVEEEGKATCSAASAEAESAVEAVMAQ